MNVYKQTNYLFTFSSNYRSISLDFPDIDDEFFLAPGSFWPLLLAIPMGSTSRLGFLLVFIVTIALKGPFSSQRHWTDGWTSVSLSSLPWWRGVINGVVGGSCSSMKILNFSPSSFRLHLAGPNKMRSILCLHENCTDSPPDLLSAGWQYSSWHWWVMHRLPLTVNIVHWRIGTRERWKVCCDIVALVIFFHAALMFLACVCTHTTARRYIIL